MSNPQQMSAQQTSAQSKWEKSLTRKLLVSPYVLFPTGFSRFALVVILLLIFIVNTIVLNQRYTEADEKFDKISDEIYSTLLGFAIAIGLFSFAVVYDMGSNKSAFGGKGILKPVFFIGLVIWALTPEIILLYSRPGCSVESFETSVVINAWIAVFLSGFGLLWLGASFVLGRQDANKLAKSQTTPKDDSDPCKGNFGYIHYVGCQGEDDFCYATNDYHKDDPTRGNLKELRYNLVGKQYEYFDNKTAEWRVCEPRNLPCRYKCPIDGTGKIKEMPNPKWRPIDKNDEEYISPDNVFKCQTASGIIYKMSGSNWVPLVPTVDFT